jgi:hypothetical protein
MGLNSLMVEMAAASETIISVGYVLRLIARERDLLMHSIWHPILVMETEKILGIFSFCGSGPKRLNEITVTFFHVPFLASVTTHGAERTLSSLNVLIS